MKRRKVQFSGYSDLWVTALSENRVSAPDVSSVTAAFPGSPQFLQSGADAGRPALPLTAASLPPSTGLSWTLWTWKGFLCDVYRYFCFLLQGLLTIIFIVSGRPSMKFLRWEWKWWNLERFRIGYRKKRGPPLMGPLECCCRRGCRNIFEIRPFQWVCCTILH